MENFPRSKEQALHLSFFSKKKAIGRLIHLLKRIFTLLKVM
ncbi:hypothetical protein [Niallia sp. 03133]